MSQAYHSGVTRTQIISPSEQRHRGPRVLVADPSVRDAVYDISVKLDEIIDLLKREDI